MKINKCKICNRYDCNIEELNENCMCCGNSLVNHREWIEKKNKYELNLDKYCNQCEEEVSSIKDERIVCDECGFSSTDERRFDYSKETLCNFCY